jgi:hypothetical protein
LDIRYSWERQLSDPAAAGARPAAHRCRSLFIVNAAHACPRRLAALAAAPEETGAQATLAVTPSLDKYSALVADAGGRLFETTLAAPRLRIASVLQGVALRVGVQAVECRGVLVGRLVTPIRDYRQLYTGAGRPARRIGPRVSTGAEFHDIGTPADYLATAQRVAAEERFLDPRFDCHIARSARIEDSVLWDRVTVVMVLISPAASVADDVVIPPGVRYDRLAITRDATTAF